MIIAGRPKLTQENGQEKSGLIVMTVSGNARNLLLEDRSKIGWVISLCRLGSGELSENTTAGRGGGRVLTTGDARCGITINVRDVIDASLWLLRCWKRKGK